MNLSQLIKQIDLVALAESAGVELRQRGPNHTGLCPLHAEKTPSFYIYPSNRFRCYGCGEGGDPADFIQCLYSCDFTEALRRLGIEGGLTLEKKIKIKRRKKIKAHRIQRERDLVFTLSILIRATRKCLATMTPERFEKYGEIMDPLPAWEHYHDVLSIGTREEKNEVLEGLKDMTTISRDYQYFKAIIEQMDNGGREALLYDLLHRKIKSNLREIHRTQALYEQMINSMDRFEKWWLHCLHTGKITSDDISWPEYLLPQEVYNSYLDHAHRDRHPVTFAHFFRRIRKICPSFRLKKMDHGSGRENYSCFPYLDDCRKNFEDKI